MTTATSSAAAAAAVSMSRSALNLEYIRKLQDTLFGAVWLARDTGSQQLFAIKESQIELIAQTASCENPRAEQKILTALSWSHPNVVRMFGHADGKNDDHKRVACTVLEYCDGGELFKRIQATGRVAASEAQNMGAQIALGLRFLHAQGIAHLDLSLENVLVSTSSIAGVPDTLKICDFGMARVLQRRSDSGPGFEPLFGGKPGKLGFQAPEVYQGGAFDGPLADVFSLGVILFMLLTGLPPFRRPSSSDQRFALLTGGQARWLLQSWDCDHVSAQAEDLLTGMLRSDPKTRLTLEQVLAHPWLKPAVETCQKQQASIFGIAKVSGGTLVSRVTQAAAAAAAATGSAVPVSRPGPTTVAPSAAAPAAVSTGYADTGACAADVIIDVASTPTPIKAIVPETKQERPLKKRRLDERGGRAITNENKRPMSSPPASSTMVSASSKLSGPLFREGTPKGFLDVV